MPTTASADNTLPIFKLLYHVLAYLLVAGIGAWLFYLAITGPSPVFYPPAIGCLVSLIVLVIDGAKGKWGLKVKTSDGKFKEATMKAKFIIYSTWAMVTLIIVWVLAVAGSLLIEFL
ncbi:MAG: hypothetical protein AAF841_03950 [Pseudomonadota bacterium]